ncbi:BREX-1 system adenine-specific DNA-methyltransferase PglX [Pseudoalteromonas sp. G24-MNA-CIBAN-0072]|uniref:BREX-1 system adenine-specific DNA-methyltransferase PglX n=1 Tax=Pseudoalteromonas sp. G24-MNA-CIBAN-0072 TaxID=3140418 RepID=UPI0033209813
MAFDQTTRNRLNRFVADSRGILAAEFTRQLQATYGMNPATGEIADINSLAGLTPHQQETAQLLRDTFEHYLAANDHTKGKSKEKESRLAALDRIVREQAFTVLNRLAALRMSEARGFLTESLANGYESKGFQLFHRIAGTSLGETGEAYTHYLFSIFDEFTLDLSVLFDRFAAQGRLFPSTPVLLELLALINDDEVAPLWAEDETIGWIYQYFNSQEERKKMRDASQAPRNSRELAVRNQFFTPRYVVEFLTDNTLGRIWYEMTKGQTKLINECEYIVKRPNEIFLIEGEQAPELDSTEGLSQEELLQQTVYIEHRALKDPRDIKMLDPACGSMHFGLYCFDLFERIYEEAWDIELAKGSECFVRENNQASLTQSYSDKAEFLTHVPRLIIENNIHGVDIDPRAAQVAGMSLWQRAHNSWQKASVKPQLRPQITKSNIVCAEPMPGEKELLQEFTSQLKPTVLGQLVEVIFEKMQLAGEAGTLLKIENEIEDAIAGAKEVWQQQNQALSQFPGLAKVAKQQSEGKGKVDFDVSDIDDEGFWQQAEQKILDALGQYASSTSANMTEQKRLFASDAAKGFAFIDLCKKRFDVVLMNPPFGAPSEQFIDLNRVSYPSSADNILISFFLRTQNLLCENGLTGAITDRSFLNKKQYEKFRSDFLIKESCLEMSVDLGWGVLDGANVEVSLSILGNSNSTSCLFLSTDNEEFENREQKLKNVDSYYNHPLKFFNSFPKKAFIYDLETNLLKAFDEGDRLEDEVFKSYGGLKSPDAEQFFRAWFEVEPMDIGKNKTWAYFQNGSPYSPFYYMTTLVVLHQNNEYRNLTSYSSARLTNKELYFKPGLCYGKRTDAIYSFKLRAGHIPSMEGHLVIPRENLDLLSLLVMNSSPYQEVINKMCGQHKYAGYINPAKFKLNSFPDESESLARLIDKVELLDSGNEISTIFHVPLSLSKDFKGLDIVEAIERTTSNMSKVVGEVNQFIDTYNSKVEENLNWYPSVRPWNKKVDHIKILYGSVAKKELEAKNLLSYLFGCLFGRWNENLIGTSFSQRFKSRYEGVEEPLKVLSQETDRSNGFIAFSQDNPTKIVQLMINKFEGVTGFSRSDFGKLVLASEIKDVDNYFVSPLGFFKDHIERYTVSKRVAPVYWLLQSYGGSFSVWFYYPKTNSQTILKVINDDLEPFIEDISKEATELRSNFFRSIDEEKRLDKIESIISELSSFKSELYRLAQFWKPNPNDGIQITAAPLWRLFQHKAWQKKLKQTWEKLEDGEYDWAHLAFSTWPERVLKKCHADRSLAIAHDVEGDLWHEVEVIKPRKKVPVWKWQPKPLSEAELHAYIKEKVATDERLNLYRSNQSANANGGAYEYRAVH